MNNYIKEPYRKSYYELEMVKQKILNCICIEENILATLMFYKTLEENINMIKNVDAIFRVNTYQYNGFIRSVILKLKSIHEKYQRNRKGNILQVIKEMISEGYDPSKTNKKYEEYFNNDPIMNKIKNFRDNTIAHDLINKTKDLSYADISEVIKQTIIIVKDLDKYLDIDEDDYEIVRACAKKDIEYYFSSLMKGLIK